MSPMFDPKELLERVDNDWDFLGETVQMLDSDGRTLIKQINDAIAAGDAPAVARAAHTLKGMVSNFCSPSTQGSALELEQMGKAGDLSAAPATLQVLSERVESLIAGLNEFVAARTQCES